MTTTSVSRRSAPVCTDDADAQIAENGETKTIDTERAKEADAETRRNAYFASGTDEGGRSYRASSDAKSWSPMLSDDPKLKASQRTAAIDRPIEDDKLGNGIIGALAGGVLGGVRAVAAKALTGGGEILGQMAVDIGKHVAIDAGKHVASDAFKEGAKAALATPAKPSETPPRPRPRPSKATRAARARSSPRPAARPTSASLPRT